jgi:predicted PurR-regulated permease PerM
MTTRLVAVAFVLMTFVVIILAIAVVVVPSMEHA